MSAMTLEKTQAAFPLDLSGLDTLIDPEDYDKEVHGAIRHQLQQGGLVSPTKDITNFQLEPDDTPGFLDSMMQKIGLSSPEVYDSSNPDAVGNYMSDRFEFITGHEDYREKAYRDSRKRRTIGYGFNLDEPTNRALYKNALKKTDKEFDALRNGTAAIDPTQARILFEASAGEAERFITNKFGGLNLKGYQRMALVSLAYNHPNLIGPGLTKALQNGDLEAVDHEIRNRSNLYKIKGIASRRALEADMFKGMGNDSGSFLAKVFGPSQAQAATTEGPPPAPQDTSQDRPFRVEDHAKIRKDDTGSFIPANVRSLALDITIERGLVQPLNDLFGLDIQTLRTEDFFDQGELDGMRRVIAPLARKKKKKKGVVNYKDYSGKTEGITFAGGIPNFVGNKLLGDHDENKVANEYIVRTTLGTFSYEVVDGDVIVTDQFNFNDAKALQEKFPGDLEKFKHLWEYSQQDDVGMYGIVRRYAGLYGSLDGKGAKFRINLGPLEEFPS